MSLLLDLPLVGDTGDTPVATGSCVFPLAGNF